MKKILQSSSILLLLILILPAFILPISPDKLSSFYYRELSYLHIAKDLQKDTKRDTLINIFEYVSDNMNAASGYGVVDKNSFNDLIRGIGWCDQQGFLLMNLLNKAGIEKTRLRDVKNHTYSEVFFDDKWIIADPFYGFMPLDLDNNFIGIPDIKDNLISDQIGLIKALDGKKSSNGIFYDGDYTKIYIPTEKRYINGEGDEFLINRRYTPLRELIEEYSKLVYLIMGKSYFHWFQDIYLETEKIENMADPENLWVTNYSKNNQKNDKSFVLFYKARNYDITNRIDKAKIYYENIIEKYPKSYWSKEAKFYLAIALYRNENYVDAEALFFDLYNINFLLNNEVGYYLGLINNYKKNYLEASKLFSSSTLNHSKVELSKIKSKIDK